jgi:hypothetical protein
MAAVGIDWDQRALDRLYADVSADVLPELAHEVEDVARSLAPVRIRRTTVPRSAKHGYVGIPGRLKASVQSEFGEDLLGPYADVAALWYGRFLDPKAKQLHRLHPFLPTALFLVAEGKDFYFS